jgi:hypothetical protein
LPITSLFCFPITSLFCWSGLYLLWAEEFAFLWVPLLVAIDAEGQQVLHPFPKDPLVRQMVDVVGWLDLAVLAHAVAQSKPSLALLLPGLGPEVFPVLATPLAALASPTHTLVLGKTELNPLLV